MKKLIVYVEYTLITGHVLRTLRRANARSVSHVAIALRLTEGALVQKEKGYVKFTDEEITKFLAFIDSTYSEFCKLRDRLEEKLASLGIVIQKPGSFIRLDGPKLRVIWDNIEDCYLDKNSPIWYK